MSYCKDFQLAGLSGGPLRVALKVCVAYYTSIDE